MPSLMPSSMPSLMPLSQPSSMPSFLPISILLSQLRCTPFFIISSILTSHCTADCCFVLTSQIKTMEQKVVMVMVFGSKPQATWHFFLLCTQTRQFVMENVHGECYTFQPMLYLMTMKLLPVYLLHLVQNFMMGHRTIRKLTNIAHHSHHAQATTKTMTTTKMMIHSP